MPEQNQNTSRNSREPEPIRPLLNIPIEDKSENIIKVVGVGGGGCNAVRNMYNEGIEGVTFAVCNTDSKSLSKSPVPVKLQLGSSGLGAGANPARGLKDAEENIEDIRNLLSDGTQMVFVTAGMGGGTGTGAAPLVARVAKSMGILTVGVVTIPFRFEMKRKIIKALRGVDEMRKNVDALLIVNNERLGDIYSDSDETVKEAFQRADNILKDAVKSISELITVEGSINIDFRDVETTTRNSGGAIMAMGRASGSNRVEKAIINALDSPLLYGNDIGKAKRIIFSIDSSSQEPLRIRELQEVDDFFDHLDPDIDVIWGTSTNESLGDDTKVTILATGIEDDLRGMHEDEEDTHDDRYYAELIPKLYKPLKRQVEEKASQDVPLTVTNTAEKPNITGDNTEISVSDSKEEGNADATEPTAETRPVTDDADTSADAVTDGGTTTLSRMKSWLQKRLNEIMVEEV